LALSLKLLLCQPVAFCAAPVLSKAAAKATPKASLDLNLAIARSSVVPLRGGILA
jgi:hypothetical protein